MLAAAQDDGSHVEEGPTELRLLPFNKIITEQHVLEASGDRRLESVRQLVMRGMQLTSFDPACAGRLRNLAVLSLSNNSLRDLEGFQSLVSMVELNLNFNNVTSLHGLCSPQLRKLFLSNNLISNLATVKNFPRLQTLCLFKNIIPDLSAALESLRGLAGLRELDLDGNPCARSRGYQHRIIQSCPRLLELDGEEITHLDRDLSYLFFEEQEKTALWRRGEAFRLKTGSNGRSDTSPDTSTRPIAGIGVKGCRGGGVTAVVARSGVRPSEDQSTFCSRFPLGKTRLFASDRLNDDPQLLAYLVQGVLADPGGSPRDVIDSLRKRYTSRSEDGRYSSDGTMSQSAFTRKITGEKGGENENQQGGKKLQSEELTPSSICGASSLKVVTTSASDPDGPLASKKYVNVEIDASKGRGCHGCVTPRNPPGEGATGVVGKRFDFVGTDGGGRASGIVVEESTHGTPREEEIIDSTPLQGTADANQSDCDFACLSWDGCLVAETTGSFDAAEISRDLILSEDKPAECEAGTVSSTDVACGKERERGTAARLGVGRRDEALRSGRPPQEPQDPPLPLPPPLAHSPTALPDPSNPHATIRKLLKVIETLQLERAQRLDGHQAGVVDHFLPRDARDVDVECSGLTTREDVLRLRLENRNMQLLLVENRELKRQAREDAARTEEKRRALSTEVESLRGQLRDVAATAERNRSNLRRPEMEYGMISACSDESLRPSRDSARNSDYEDACEQQRRRRLESTDDEELEGLFRRNERTMRKIRRDLALARRETFDEPPHEPPTSAEQPLGTCAKSAASSGAQDPNPDRGDGRGETAGRVHVTTLVQ